MKLPFKKSKESNSAPFTPQTSDSASRQEKKNSFRNMMILIFVILLCFGGTIYGIIYIIDAFDKSSEAVAPKQAQRPPVTNPDQGDVLMFSKNEQEGDEVMPDSDNLIKSIEMKRDRNVNTSNIQEEPEVDTKKPEPLPTRRPNIVIIDNKEEPKKVEPKKEVAKVEPKKEEAKPAPKEEPKKEEPKKVEPMKEVAKTEPKKEEAKPVAKAEPKKQATPKQQPKPEVKKAAPTKQNTKTVAVTNPETFVVQAAALDKRENAVNYAKRIQKDFPDVFVMEAMVDGKMVYRVRLGVSESYAEARKVADRLDAKYKTKSMVITNR